MSKRVIITGGSGLIGKPLSQELITRGYTVYVLTRKKSTVPENQKGNCTLVTWDARSSDGWADIADGAFAIINLAGDNVASGRWTRTKKDRIISSRLNATHAVIEAIERSSSKPHVVIQASAAGYYGMTLKDTVFDETGPMGSGYLATVTRRWEDSSLPIEKAGIRRVVIRTGLVLARHGGALKKLTLPYQFFAGGHVGTGWQYMSWIHMKDQVNAIIYLMENSNLAGVFNLTAPNPVTSREFSRALGRVMRRPAWLPVPSFAVKFLFGEMGEEALLLGQRVVPKRLAEEGFTFRFPDIHSALKDLAG